MSSFNSAYGAGLSPRPHLVRMVREGKKDHASFHRASKQTGSNTSPGLFASASARPRGEDMASLSFPHRPFLMQFAIDVLAVLVAFTLIAASCIGFGFAVFALLFLSF